jgi:GTP pyrophosphokinase
MEKRFAELRKKLSLSKEKDRKLLDKAWRFAKEAHRGQIRFSGEPYATHPLETALILAEWKLDLATIIAGILHDTIEDAGVRKEDLEAEFGSDIAYLVEGVSKVSSVKLRGSKEIQFVENLRKMFLAMARDLRVVFVKLADRLHNMRTLWALPSDRQKKIAWETLEIYAPLAERLGMGEVKGDLEDLAFFYLYPDEYQKLVKISKPYYKEAELIIRSMKKKILRYLAEEKIKVVVQSRKKHFYSLWMKLKRPEIGGDFSKIYDIVALRIIVEDNNIPACYTSLGIIHNFYKPVPYLGISDFIAQPKPNGYRSIHTKVFGPKGKIVEIQIRTQEMHLQAEYGLAAHWAYSEEKTRGKGDAYLEKKGVKISKEKMLWVRQLADLQKEIVDPKEYFQAIRLDVLGSRNFVFSPAGDVYDLPAGATPVDFAYSVHTHLGKYINGVKVNGKIVPLDYKLKSGDIVEIIKSKNPRKPHRDWLDFVVTNVAKREIKKALR